MPLDDQYHNEHTARRPRLSSHLALPRGRTTHFPGDGMDFRRPVMSSQGHGYRGGEASGWHGTDIIDLTSDPIEDPRHAESAREDAAAASSSRATRFPRFGRDIIGEESEGHPRSEGHDQDRPLFIDLSSSLTDQHTRYSDIRRTHRPAPSTDDDIQVLSPDTAFPVRSNNSAMPAQRSVTPYPPGRAPPIDLTGDDDDLVLLNTRTVQGVNLGRPTISLGNSIPDEQETNIARLFHTFEVPVNGRLVDHVRRRHPNLLNQRNRDVEILERYDNRAQHNNRPRPTTHSDRNLRPGHSAPVRTPIWGGFHVALDYHTPAFDLGYAGANQAAAPKYVPPPAPDAGFTRTPAEDDVVVCPNCGDELAMGDNEAKQEVWVVKTCGHVSQSPMLVNLNMQKLIPSRHTAAIAHTVAPNLAAKLQRKAKLVRRKLRLGCLSRVVWFMDAASLCQSPRWCTSTWRARSFSPTKNDFGQWMPAWATDGQKALNRLCLRFYLTGVSRKGARGVRR